MRIAYLGQMADVSSENGISKKILSQSLHWCGAGHEVRYFSLVPTTVAWSSLAQLRPGLVARGPLGLRMIRSFTLVRQIRDWRPDIIYFRYAYHSAGLPALFRTFPTVAEINSHDLTEYPLTLSRAKFVYHRLTRRRLLCSVTGFVSVTHELAACFASFGRPVEVIANGIDLDAFSPVPPPLATAPLRLVFIGSAGTPWHGLERVCELAQLLPDVAIDVVGLEGKVVLPGIRFHGPLPRERYATLLATATAALGTLALHRKQMHEACPLKVREYLAAGLPVIGAYRDTDIPADANYFFRLPNDTSPLSLYREQLVAWLEHWRGRRVPRAAVAHIDTTTKEAKRLLFLQSFVQRSPE